MKVLLLNPDFDMMRNLADALRMQGAVVLEVSDSSHALAILSMHGRTVDLAILHREGPGGRGDSGANLVREIRSLADQGDLPLILTSSNWGDPQFAQHQNSPQGCHAYLKLPSAPDHLVRLVEGVLGASLMDLRGKGEDALRGMKKQNAPSGASVLPPASKPLVTGTIEIPTESPPSVGKGLSTGAAPMIVLEDASGIHTRSGVTKPESGPVGIVLEAPSSLVLRPAKPVQEAPSLTIDAPVNREIPTLSPVVLEEPSKTGPAIDLQTMPEPLVREAAPADVPVAESLAADFGESVPPSLQLSPDLSPVEGSLSPSLAPFGSAPVESQSGSGDRKLAFSTAGEAELRHWMNPPIDDSIVPGGAVEAPDEEVLKKYLLLREQDVAALSQQLRSAKQRVQALDESLEFEKARSAELSHQIEIHKGRESEFEMEKQALRESLEGDLAELRLQLKARSDRARTLELQVRAAADETEALRERVRQDLRRIRVREQELENRLELLKRDSQSQIQAREEKLTEVRRRSDLMEFNYELVQTQLEKEREQNRKLREQLAQFSKMVRMAGGLLDGESLPDGLLGAFSGESDSEVGTDSPSGDTGFGKKSGRAA
jgi:hypothetical protein